MPIPTAFLPTERLIPEEVLRQASKIGDNPLLTAMLDTAPGMIALLNPQRQIVACNEACATAGGLPGKESALGLRPGELLNCIHSREAPGGCGTSEPCSHCGLAQALVGGQEGHARTSECLMQSHHSGRDISAEYAVHVKPLPQLGNGWMTCSISDISAEKRRAALERAFFHDIINRAAAVQGLSRMLADEKTTPEKRAGFARMLAVCSRAFVEEIRSQCILLAAEKGELTVHKEECDSLTALQAAIAACQAFGSDQSQQLTISPDVAPILFDTDETLLGRILVNMLKNALEASGEHGTVTAGCSLTASNRIRFWVHNDTVMPGHVQAHVFARSFSTKGSGRGLGTYSIRLLCETYLGGRTWFDSAAGKGTTFYAEFAI